MEIGKSEKVVIKLIKLLFPKISHFHTTMAGHVFKNIYLILMGNFRIKVHHTIALEYRVTTPLSIF